jgi:hypothetical protein
MEFAKKCRDTRIQRDRFLMVTLQIGKEEKLRGPANPHSRASEIAAAARFFFLLLLLISNSTTTTFKRILTLFRISAQSAFAADLL